MKFLSIKDALQKYEVTQTTLTRFARTHQKTKNVKKENRKYFILDSFLASHFQVVASHLDSLTIHTSNQSEPKKESSTNEKDKNLESGKIGSELVNSLKSQNEFLQSQIISKDVQLSKMDSQLVEKDNQINKLLQRQYEQNSIIQTMQNRFDLVGKQIDTSTLLISEKVTQKNEVIPGISQTEKGNDNGFTIASAILILLAVALLVLFVAYK